MRNSYIFFIKVCLSAGLLVFVPFVRADWVLDRNGNMLLYQGKGQVLGEQNQSDHGQSQTASFHQSPTSEPTATPVPADTSVPNSGVHTVSSGGADTLPTATAEPTAEPTATSVPSPVATSTVKPVEYNSQPIPTSTPAVIILPPVNGGTFVVVPTARPVQGGVIPSNSSSAPKIIRKILKQDIKTIETSASAGSQLKMKILTDVGDQSIDYMQETFEIELPDGVLKVSADENGKVNVEMGGMTAKLDYPVSVDPGSNALLVETQGGTRELTVLPNKAVSIAAKAADISDDPKTTTMSVKYEGNGLEYRITGMKTKRVFGLIPANIYKDVSVSAENGAVVKTSASLPMTVLDALSW